MGRILISEEEKQRILGMHVEKGYTSVISEQPVGQQPQQTQKPQEVLTYWNSDPVGTKLSSTNPALVNWMKTNSINPKAAKLTFINNTQVSAVGTDGKQYVLNIIGFDGKIPTDWKEKYTAAFNAVRQKANEYLANDTTKRYNCFNPSTLEPNQTGYNSVGCKIPFEEYNKVVDGSGYKTASNNRNYANFLAVAPKYQPKKA